MDFVIDSMYHADKIKNIIYVPGFDVMYMATNTKFGSKTRRNVRFRY